MPQMAPMNWTLLMGLFIFGLIITINKISLLK